MATPTLQQFLRAFSPVVNRSTDRTLLRRQKSPLEHREDGKLHRSSGKNTEWLGRMVDGDQRSKRLFLRHNTFVVFLDLN